MLMIAVVIFIFHDSRVSSFLKFEIFPVYLADTEKNLPFTAPANEAVWTRKQVAAQNVGFMFAGKTEFSWLVDLRVFSTDQEFWSIGNLYTASWVMTTCRAKYYLEEAWQGDTDPGDKGTITDPVRVTFFRLYFWEYLGRNNDQDEGTWPFGGTRRVEKYFTHPSCDVRKLKYDITMLKLKVGVSPVVPYIGYMPFSTDPNTDRGFADIDFSRVEAQRVICYVGSVGRKYVNLKNHVVRDFKVTFRVYHESLESCMTLVGRLCNSSKHDCSEAFARPGIPGREWECMKTRARVGTVCDHDRGAPVVCNGQVFGMVSYGAKFENCNDRIPMPFVVIKLHSYSEWSEHWNLD